MILALAALLSAPAGAQETVPWSDVRALRRVEPAFPREAFALEQGPYTCDVRFFIDEAGKPYDVTVEGCPELFHPNTLEAAYKWRFAPVIGPDGRPTKATFLLKLTFMVVGSPPGGPGADLFTLGGAWTPPLQPEASPALGRGFNAEIRVEGHGFALGLAAGYAADLAGAPGARLAYLKALVGPSFALVEGGRWVAAADALVGLGPGLTWEDGSRDKGYGPGVSWQFGLPVALLGEGGSGVSLRPAIGGSRHLDYGALSGTDAPLRSFLHSGVGVPFQAQIGLYLAGW